MTARTIDTATKIAGRSHDHAFYRRMPGQSAPLPEQDAKREAVSNSLTQKILMVSAALLIMAVALFFIARLYGESISRGGHTASKQVLEIIISNDVLHVPSNTIRYTSQRRPGPIERLELYLHWPSLSGYSDALRAEFNNSGENSNLIFLTLEPRTMSYDMSGRIAPIYRRFFEGAPADAGNGLVKQALSPDGGFVDEDLYYAANSPYPFAARCLRERSTIGTPFCIRDIHIAKGLMLTYRFHKRFLTSWIDLDHMVRSRVKSMLVAKAG